MSHSRHCILAIVAASALAALGCQDTKHPAADPTQAPVDEALLGVWLDESPDSEPTYYHIGPAGGLLPKSVLRVVMVGHDGDSLETPEEVMIAIPAKCGAKRVLSLASVSPAQFKRLKEGGWKPELVGGYLLFRYEIEGDTMAARAVNSSSKSDLIAAGKLAGEKIDHGERFTAATDQLAEFLASSESDALFAPDAGKLKRIGPPRRK